jgi:serine phosphatase RsbU (regulator of sigma subunit)/Tfp pilus assembly protein PilF
MCSRFISAICIAIFIVIQSSTLVEGQSSDSLLHLLNHYMVKDDNKKFKLLCEIALNSADADTILKYSELAIKLAEKLNINPAQPFVLKGFGYLTCGKLDSSLAYLMKAANYYKADHNNIGLATAYNYISDAYNQQDNYDNAIYYLKNAVAIFRQEKDTLRLVSALNNLGYVNYCMGKYDTALIVYSNTSEIYQKLGHLSEYAICLGNSGLVYSRQSEFQKAEEYLLRAVDILTKQAKQSDERAVTEFMIEYAGILQHKGEIGKAIAFATVIFGKASENNFLSLERDAAYRLAKLYQASGKFDSAYHYQSLYINANDSIKSVRNIQKMADQRTEFEVAKKQAEVDVLRKNKLIQLIVIIGLVLVILLAIGLILVYYYSLKRSQKLTTALDERRILLEKQGQELKERREELMQQKEEIISSINYAKRIQSAILPPQWYINEILNKNFIFYKPKEIVSGDFYWIKRVKSYTILVSADCTGHGVPGAFMSMLGISLLNEIVERRGITQANQILNEMREQIKQSLRQVGNEAEPKDGMDIALCVIDNNNNMMQFSGANNPLYIIKNNNGESEFKEIIADQMPVGFYLSNEESFSNHEIKLNTGDTFYIFSDGYIDQNGGDENQRFNSSKFKKLLIDIHEQPMTRQKAILEQTLKDWMGEHSQRDDILVIGVKV